MMYCQKKGVEWHEGNVKLKEKIVRILQILIRSWWHGVLTVKRTKYFWFPSPTQLFTQGQWWSILRIHLWQTEQWWALSGLMLQHLGHLKITWPSLKPICWMYSFVAFPRGTAPYNAFQWLVSWWAWLLLILVKLTGSLSIVLKWEETASTVTQVNKTELIKE